MLEVQSDSRFITRAEYPHPHTLSPTLHRIPTHPRIPAPTHQCKQVQTQRVSSLNHEPFDHPMEDMSVVVAVTAVFAEVLYSLWTAVNQGMQSVICE